MTCEIAKKGARPCDQRGRMVESASPRGATSLNLDDGGAGGGAVKVVGSLALAMLRSKLCCPRSNVAPFAWDRACRCNIFRAGLKALDKRERRGWWRQRPGFAIRRRNAIEHASLELRPAFEVHVRRVERLVVEPVARWSRWQNQPKYVALTPRRSESPPSLQGALSTQAAGCPSRYGTNTQHSSERNISRYVARNISLASLGDIPHRPARCAAQVQ